MAQNGVEALVGETETCAVYGIEKVKHPIDKFQRQIGDCQWASAGESRNRGGAVQAWTRAWFANDVLEILARGFGSHGMSQVETRTIYTSVVRL
jgi:hypothetical protein